MSISEAYVRDLFKHLENGDGAAFFERVDDKVDWTVEGTHPLAGHYRSKADFIAGTFAKLNKVLPHGTQLLVSPPRGTDFVSTTTIAGSCILAARSSTGSAPIWTRRWSSGCLLRIRSIDPDHAGRCAGEPPAVGVSGGSRFRQMFQHGVTGGFGIRETIER